MHRVLGLVLTFALFASTAQARDIGKDLERGLGEMVAAEIEAAYGVVDDPLLVDWVDRVGQRLAAASGRTDVKYRFRILDSDDVNAVAAPGGYIYVNRGVLRFIKSEDELAAVMGHEVGHVAGKHAMKQMTAQVLGTLVLLGFQAAHAETLKTVGSIAGGLAMLKFSRDEENDADRRGLKNMTAIGYDGTAMLDFFRRLQSTEKGKPSALEAYFLTHPPTEERLRRVAREPGLAETSLNAAALGDGCAARFLFRQAAESYRRALQLDPENMDLKYRLADALRRMPQKSAARPLLANVRADRLKQLDAFGKELADAQQEAAEDRKRLADAQKSIDSELDQAARSLSSASQMISRRDAVQYRQFLRMARSFDQATRGGGILRSAREMADETLDGLSRLRQTMQRALEEDDGAAADQVEGLRLDSPAILKDLTMGLKQARSGAGEALGSVRALRQAADSLLASYRSPLGYTSGQFDILDLQVSTAQDSMNDGVASARRALSLIARARVGALVARINYLTRSIVPDDPATTGLLARYLGVEPSAVRAMRVRLEFGGAALALAQDRMEASRTKKKSARTNGALPAVALSPTSPPTLGKGSGVGATDGALRWENAAILFNLIVNDLERETTSTSQ